MMRERVTRIANPRKRRRNASVARNRSGQFVKRKRKANTRKRVTARKRAVRHAPKKRRTKRKSNPSFLVTLGTVNPRKRSKKRVARTRRKSVRRRRRVARTSNPPVRRRRRVAAAPVRRRRRRRAARAANPRRRRRNTSYRRRRRNGYSRSRRNPSIGGTISMAEKGLGVLIGVAAAKMIPTFIPAQFVTSPILRIIATGASAYIASIAMGKVRPSMADAVLWGGFAQTISVALNQFLPSIGSQIGLNGFRGMGDLVDGHFVVPQNPINYLAPARSYDGAMPGVAPRVAMSGIDRSFGRAF